MPSPTQADLANQMSALIDRWRVFINQHKDWLNGSPTGGPAADGKYPLTDSLGNTSLVACPAKQAAMVSTTVDSAGAHANAAQTARTGAEAARDAAQRAESIAASHASLTATARDLAKTYADTAGSHAANARTDATNAANSASQAAASAASMDQAVADTDADRIAADNARIAAEAARDKSKLWAEQAVDAVVEGSTLDGTATYSAKHHAAKASTSATNAANSAAAADASKTAAATSETNAANSASAANTSKTAAATSETNAATSATNAATSATNASTSASNAKTHENNAGMSATQASDYSTAAGTAKTAAEAARDKANLWANQAVDVVVEGTSYSAFHWSEKAKAWAATVDTSSFLTKAAPVITGTRLQGVFGGALDARTYLQGSTANEPTNVGILPNGTSTTSLVSVWNSSDPLNAGTFQFRMDAGMAVLNSSNTGTGVVRPISVQFGGVEKAAFGTNGTFSATGEIISTNANQFRLVYGNYGLIFRQDGSNFYMLPTNSLDQYGPWNSLRPFYMDMASGLVTMSHGVNVVGRVYTNGNFVSEGASAGLFFNNRAGTTARTYGWYSDDSANGVSLNVSGVGNVVRITEGGAIHCHSVQARGSIAELVFHDRTSDRRWLWYGTGDRAYLYNGSANIVQFGTGGGLALGRTLAGPYWFETAGRVRFGSSGATAGAWYDNSGGAAQWFCGLYDDNNWGVYDTTAGWKFLVGVDGRPKIKDANSATLRQQPRIFIGDPGAAAAAGDLIVE